MLETIEDKSIFNYLKKNRARFLICGDIIESKFVHDFQSCSCGNLSVDGGHEYARRCYATDKWKDLSEYEGLA